MSQQKPIGIYHEHQDWFRPLFAELDRRHVPYVRIDARSHRFDPRSRPFSEIPYSSAYSESANSRADASSCAIL